MGKAGHWPSVTCQEELPLIFLPVTATANGAAALALRAAQRQTANLDTRESALGALNVPEKQVLTRWCLLE